VDAYQRNGDIEAIAAALGAGLPIPPFFDRRSPVSPALSREKSKVFRSVGRLSVMLAAIVPKSAQLKSCQTRYETVSRVLRVVRCTWDSTFAFLPFGNLPRGACAGECGSSQECHIVAVLTKRFSDHSQRFMALRMALRGSTFPVARGLFRSLAMLAA